MGPKGAVEIIFRAELDDRAKIEARTDEYRERFANPFSAARRGFIDDVIRPRNSRKRIGKSLRMLRDKDLQNPWKKHDNIPL
jgi:propionyl-CoA carboxylase beta chain